MAAAERHVRLRNWRPKEKQKKTHLILNVRNTVKSECILNDPHHMKNIPSCLKNSGEKKKKSFNTNFKITGKNLRRRRFSVNFQAGSQFLVSFTRISWFSFSFTQLFLFILFFIKTGIKKLKIVKQTYFSWNILKRIFLMLLETFNEYFLSSWIIIHEHQMHS